VADAPLQSDPAQTATRVGALDSYFKGNVTRDGAFICPTAAQCKASHHGDFYESQLHHVGRHFDLVRNGQPLRVVVVGQEYGHGPRFASLEYRQDMILNDSGLGSRFKAQDGVGYRNPHMKGCTSLLRLIFGLGLGSDHEGEFLALGGERVHIFDCFALVNFLLCSAVPPSVDGGGTPRRLGGKPGRSTRTMRSNCAIHFRAALQVLQPTMVVAQGYGVRDWIGDAFGLPSRSPEGRIEPLRIGDRTATLVSFSHPSAHGAYNWGANDRTPYLLGTVVPTIARVCG
jgi:hypothetical protein